MKRLLSSGLLGLVLVLANSIPTQAGPSYTLFESGPVRPLALSADGSRLYAVNTPDNRLEIFSVTAHGLVPVGSTPVGLEPVAVAVRDASEVWVVNHVSDSVSVVDVSVPARARVKRTLLVGDEPRDIVFAGPNHDRAFITTAHRGQNSPIDPQLTMPGVGRADVWVFDARNLGSSLGADPLTIITLFADTPRALAVSPDGRQVYAAAFHSGNQTTVVHVGTMFRLGWPPPTVNFEGLASPPGGLIVKYDGAHWVDEIGRVYDDVMRFNLPDHDVFVLDATASPPRQVAGSAGHYSGVGTVLFNMAVNPVNGKIYVSNTEARNEVRFEGPGIFAGHSLGGRLHDSRVTVLSSSQVLPRHLNKHLDDGSSLTAKARNALSLASPQGMAITKDGKTLYVAAFNSSKIGIYDTAQLEADTFVAETARQIRVSGGGPSGPVLDEKRHRLYAYTRFNNSLAIIDTRRREQIASVPMYNPEPEHIVDGRRFLYDAAFSSSRGDASCASCHVFGDLDSLAWDLGNPDEVVVSNPGLFIGPPVVDPAFHPLKGPMVTQSLRGMANHGPMHWRGDRTADNGEQSLQPDGGTFDEDAAFKKFNGAFVSLLGRTEQIPAADMQAFADFILELTYPPNAIRRLDNELTPFQQAGFDFFFNNASGAGPFGGRTCGECHVLDNQGNAEFGVSRPGFFGSDGRHSFGGGPQTLKVPHLRNLYQKVGMFGIARIEPHVGTDEFMGDQIRGFGFSHDGAMDTLLTFNSAAFFNMTDNSPGGFVPGPAGDVERQQVEDYMLVFEGNLAPAVGQQITLGSRNRRVTAQRVDFLIERAEAKECDLVAKGRLKGRSVGFLYVGNGRFVSDRAAWPAIPTAVLKALTLVPAGELTFTCAPPGSGRRIAIDRDEDGLLDGDELRARADPANLLALPSE